MGARTERVIRWVTLVTLVSSVPAFAQDDADESDDSGVAIDELRFRVSGYNQHGRGLQSRASANAIPVPSGTPGLERLGVFQSLSRVGFRQNERVRHTLDLAVDIVTSASADALDAISSASRVNEAATLDGRTYFDPTDDDHLTFNLGYHLEETLKSGHGGVAYTRDLAQDNATIGASVNLLVDFFDPISPWGFDYGFTRRTTLNANVSASQVLSPTTVAWVAYGLTFQTGTLEQTWNAVPLDNNDHAAERIPDTRLRHAMSVELAQMIPQTRTTLRGRYRFYVDDFGVQAHTASFRLFQRLGERAWLELGYRLHDQTAVSFFTREAAASVRETASPRTSDSDLAAFRAHEASAGLRYFLSLASERRGAESIDLRYSRYARTNGLHVDLFTLGYAREF